jgi:uncharacterized membrane protein
MRFLRFALMLMLFFGSSFAQVNPNQVQGVDPNQSEVIPEVPGVKGVVTALIPSTSSDIGDVRVKLETGQTVNVIDDIGLAKVGGAVEVVEALTATGAKAYHLSPGDDPPYLEGSVIRIVDIPKDLAAPQDLEVRLTSGKLVTVSDDNRRFGVGDTIEIYPTLGPNNEFIFYASDFIRRTPIAILIVVFVVVAGVVGRAKGLRAVVGMAFSLGVIILAMIPAIVSGISPVLVAVLGASVILASSVYFVHGLNWTASSALVATIVAAIVTLGLAMGFSSLAKLTGLGAEEGVYIMQAAQQAGIDLNLRGLLIAGILIGSLGALVDSTVAQAAVVRELSNLNPKLEWQKLYKSGMSVGFDHIGSLVNTLVLANVGSSLPLWVLFTLGQTSFTRVINLELVASEIVHALVGSIGLILAVPLATLIAALVFRGGRYPGSDGVHSHAQVYVPKTREDALTEALQLPGAAQKGGSRLLEEFKRGNSEGSDS